VAVGVSAVPDGARAGAAVDVEHVRQAREEGYRPFMAVRVVLLVLALLAFVPAFLVISDRASSPDSGVLVGLLAASPFLVLGTLLGLSALLMERRR
jgi:hypothetical protein